MYFTCMSDAFRYKASSDSKLFMYTCRFKEIIVTILKFKKFARAPAYMRIWFVPLGQLLSSTRECVFNLSY